MRQSIQARLQDAVTLEAKSNAVSLVRLPRRGDREGCPVTAGQPLAAISFNAQPCTQGPPPRRPPRRTHDPTDEAITSYPQASVVSSTNSILTVQGSHFLPTLPPMGASLPYSSRVVGVKPPNHHQGGRVGRRTLLNSPCSTQISKAPGLGPYLPLKCGSLFSRKALAPSKWSSVWRHILKARCSQLICVLRSLSTPM